MTSSSQTTTKKDTQKPSTEIDKSQIPAELSVQQSALDIRQLLTKADGDKVNFTYGTYIPGAVAFNQYLEANVGPGDTKVMTKGAVIKMIKQLALTLNSGGLASLPMLCLSKDCPRYESCPIKAIGEQVPVGEPCPVEKTEALAHVRGLSEDFGQGRTYADQIMIQGVSSVQVIKSRVMSDLSRHAAPVIKVNKGVDAQGRVVRELTENPNIGVLAKLQKQEHLLLKGLHLTQEQRKKLEGQETITSDVVLSQLKNKLHELRRSSGTEGLEIKDIEVNQVTEEELSDGEPVEEVLRGGVEGNVGTDTPGSEGEGGQSDKGERLSSDTDAGDITTRSGRVAQEVKDYRSDERKGSTEGGRNYIGQSPFKGRSPGRPNSNPRPDADSMEETF
jgi:hypothetical protein